MAARLWLLEGLPGSGKTTTAEKLCYLCNAADQDARWWLEEDENHPATPSSLRKRGAEADFGSQCVSAYRGFVRCETGILILEGSAFQSTARFMFANQWDDRRIHSYLVDWSDAVSSANPRLILLTIADVRRHFEDVVVPARGAEWLERLVAYVERTPLAISQRWTGVEGFVRFWSDYQRLIIKLASQLTFPMKIVEGWSPDQGLEAKELLPSLLS